MVNFDEYFDTGSHWIALYANAKNIMYFHSFAVEQISTATKKVIKRSIDKFTIVSKIFRIQTYV